MMERIVDAIRQRVFKLASPGIVKRSGFYCFLFVLLAPFLIIKIYSTGIWKSLVVGRYVFLKGSFPAYSEFSFSPAVKSINLQAVSWLMDIGLYLIQRVTGYAGLQFFRIAIALFAILVIHWMFRWKTNPLMLLTLVVVVVGLQQKLLLKNAIVLIPFLIVVFGLWYRLVHSKNTIVLWGLPVLMMLWGNLHFSFLFGFGFFFVLLLGEGIDRLLTGENCLTWHQFVTCCLVLVLCLAVILVVRPNIASMYKKLESAVSTLTEVKGTAPDQNSPVIVKGWKFLRGFVVTLFTPKSFSAGQNQTPGMASPLAKLDLISIRFSLWVGIIGLVSFLIPRFRFRTSLFLAVLSGVILGLMYVRSVALIPLVVVPVFSIRYSLGDFDGFSLAAWVQWGSVILMLTGGIFVYYSTYTGTFHRVSGSTGQQFGWGLHTRFSKKAPEYALQHYPDKPFYNDFGIGSYLIWKWWPRKKVFIGTRTLAYKSTFMSLALNNPQPLIEHDTLDFRHAIVSSYSSSPFYYFIPHPYWKLEAWDKGMFVFVKQKKSGDRSPGKRLLYGEAELTELPTHGQNRVRRVRAFIKVVQNKPQYVGRYPSPVFNPDMVLDR